MAEIGFKPEPISVVFVSNRQATYMLQQFFSYIPRSGPRLLAKLAGDQFVLCQLHAGTLIVGDLVRLQFSTAEPGFHCRQAVGRLAIEIVSAFGGLAEDSQGVVTILVPTKHAADAVHYCEQLLPSFLAETLDSQLWQQQLATITRSGYVRNLYQTGRRIQRITSQRTEDEGCWLEIVFDDETSLIAKDKGRNFLLSWDHRSICADSGNSLSESDCLV